MCFPRECAEEVHLLGDGMIVGIGTDLLDVGRMARELSRPSEGFRDDVFTPAEVSYCEARAHPAQHYAARFAAKEAFWKALGAPAGAPLRDVEVERGELGPPRLVLKGRALAEAGRLGVEHAHVSLTHTTTLASACVVLEGGSKREGDEG